MGKLNETFDITLTDDSGDKLAVSKKKMNLLFTLIQSIGILNQITFSSLSSGIDATCDTRFKETSDFDEDEDVGKGKIISKKFLHELYRVVKRKFLFFHLSVVPCLSLRFSGLSPME